MPILSSEECQQWLSGLQQEPQSYLTQALVQLSGLAEYLL